MSWFSPKLMQWCASNSSLFVESGTYTGNTTNLAAKYFSTVFSVEFDESIYLSTRERFSNNDRIKLWHGKSEDAFPEILKLAGQHQATFWLDSHPMEPTPGQNVGIMRELEIIKDQSERNDHLILIDDYPFILDQEPGYPPLQDIIEMIKQINSAYIIEYLPLQRYGTKHGDPAIIAASIGGVSLSPKDLLRKERSFAADSRKLIRKLLGRSDNE